MWTTIAIWIVVSTQGFGNLEDSWTLGKVFLLFLPGSLLLAYGVLLGERQPDLKLHRIVALTIVMVIATMAVCSWFYFMVNFAKT